MIEQQIAVFPESLLVACQLDLVDGIGKSPFLKSQLGGDDRERLHLFSSIAAFRVPPRLLFHLSGGIRPSEGAKFLRRLLR